MHSIKHKYNNEIHIRAVHSCVLALGLLAYLGSIIPTTRKEGFQSHGFASCRGSGFSKEFCLQNPSMPGAVGTFQPGFKGRCVCPFI